MNKQGWKLAALVVLAAACTDPTAVEAPDRTINAAVGPPNGFAVVMVRQDHRAGSGHGPIVDNLADAVARVRPGGTIRVFAGTYAVDGVAVDKPVTIQAAGEGGSTSMPVIEVRDDPDDADGFDGGNLGFRVDGVPDGTVTFRGLKFVVPGGERAGIQAAGVYDRVVVEDCVFELLGEAFGGATAGIEAGSTATGAGSVLIRNNEFRGGLISVFAWGGAATELLGNRIGGQAYRAVQYQSGAAGRMEANRIDRCGVFGCVGAFGSEIDVVRNEMREDRTDVDGFLHHVIMYADGSVGRIEQNVIDGCGLGQCILAISRASVEIIRNSITAYAEHGTRFGIIGSDGTICANPDEFDALGPTLTVVGNTITGVGGTADADPTNPDAYAIELAGIQAECGARATAFGNTITNAQFGFTGHLRGVIADGGDNVVSRVHLGVGSWLGSEVTLRSSDFSDYQIALDVDDGSAASDLTCNWWGTAAGPRSPRAPDPGIYTPWATAPVAGTSTTTCGGGAAATAAAGSTVQAATLAEATGAAGDAGTWTHAARAVAPSASGVRAGSTLVEVPDIDGSRRR